MASGSGLEHFTFAHFFHKVLRGDRGVALKEKSLKATGGSTPDDLHS